MTFRALCQAERTNMRASPGTGIRSVPVVAAGIHIQPVFNPFGFTKFDTL